MATLLTTTRSRLLRLLPRVRLTLVRVEPQRPTRRKRLAAFVSRNRVPVLFVVFLIATDWAIGQFAAVWERHSPDDYTARVNGCRSKPRDIVFVGGSPVAEGIDPDRIPGSNYAVGLAGGTTSDIYHAVLRACDRPPRVLVYGMTASDINDARGEPHGPAALMTWGDIGRWVRLRPDAAEWATRHFLQARLRRASSLFHHRHGIRMWAATEAERVSPGSCPEALREAVALRDDADALRDSNGYVPVKWFAFRRYDVAKARGDREAPLPFFQKYRTGSHLKYLHKLVDWCEANGVALAVVDVPVTADLESRFGKEFAEYRARLAEVEAARGLKVLRPTREGLGLTDAYFADAVHMNRAGAWVFSLWLGEMLKALGLAV